ncbi:urea amidolyase [uncultured Pelagimonas sp.]|uniref:5-oxoprolinase subunit C family protein n=1 Tax=uncultured Pelagimonas sp. TaxID=1618102 RepID=UPI00262C0B5E|nr:urea amidolyase [uncultured Pelagimonas sp.]
MTEMIVHSAGPGVTVQDDGRGGYLALGLSRGGAADRIALFEAAALLAQPIGAVLELPGFGGRFEVTQATRIAFCGAPMRARIDGVSAVWNASHLLPAGAILDIGAVTQGVYGYLAFGGGLATPHILGGQGTHLTAGLGRVLQSGDRLPLGPDKGGDVGQTLDPLPRWDGGTARVLPSLQTEMFSPDQRQRFEASPLTRDTRANRMGVRMLPDGEGFGLTAGGTILSEVITPGDIQIPGDGAPYVLLSECQTTGGYPRIGTVIPADLPRVAQTPAGARLQFRFVTRDDAMAAEAEYRRSLSDLPRKTYPLVRDPADIPDLLSYSLISGVTAGEEM